MSSLFRRLHLRLFRVIAAPRLDIRPNVSAREDDTARLNELLSECRTRYGKFLDAPRSVRSRLQL